MNLLDGKKIGTNLFSTHHYGWLESSFDGEFTDELVFVENGFFGYRPSVMGDIKDVYIMLNKKIKERNPQNFEEISECVFAVIWEYFGDYSNVETRIDNYIELGDLESIDDIGKVSDLKGKNSAMCTERAMLSQNLLKFLGINSFYKSSAVDRGDRKESHAYNLVEYEGKCYIFDATIPTVYNDEISPLIGEIPQEVFDMISSPKMLVGYSVEVSHFNPLQNEEVYIVYDCEREKKYSIVNTPSINL